MLYVGKAKDLKNRISSYKQWQTTAGKTRRLVFQATRLKHQVLESELEALLVEAELIRTHQPQFNILLKDDKTPLYVQITDDEYPRVLTIRKKEVEKQKIQGTVFGPFQSAFKVKEVLGIARRIFPYCSAPRNQLFGTPENKPCFDYHLDLCNGACIGAVTPAEYGETIQQLKVFLRGKKKEVIQTIQAEMEAASEAEKYEYAADLRDRIKLVKEVTERKYQLRPKLHLPNLKESMRAEGLIYLRRLLATHFKLPKTYPLTRIEGYDVSNIQGTNATVAQVVFVNGQSAKEEYRLFNIKTLKTPNDFAMLQEALIRRQNHLEWGIPNLILIDGGKGQLRAALKVWYWHCPVISLAKKPDRIIIPYFEEAAKKSGGKISTQNENNGETKIVPIETESILADLRHLKYIEIRLEEQHPALHILQQIRDESHRFSKFQHTRLRDNKMFE